MSDHFSSRFIAWAQGSPTVQVLVQIGSRVRPVGSPTGADAHSDWDFQIVTSDAASLLNPAGFAATGVGEPLAFTARTGRLGSVPKITALFPDGLLDLVVIPLDRVQALFAFGTQDRRADNRSARDLAEIALVFRGGYRFLKDTLGAGPIVAGLIAASPPPRLGDSEIANLAAAFLCDSFAVRGQLRRGELRATQRFLHTQLAETNFALLQELMLREGRTVFPDARRLEATVPAEWVDVVTVDAAPTATSLAAALDRVAAACEKLAATLLRDSPLLPPLAQSFARARALSAAP